MSCVRVVVAGRVVTLVAVVALVLFVVDHQLTLWQARRDTPDEPVVEFTPEREAAVGFALPHPDEYYTEDE